MSGCLALSIVIFGVGWYLSEVLKSIQRTIAKLPLNIPEKREVVLSPRQEAREGDVKFHFPSSMTFRDE
jgi:hypothetical protein